MIRRLTFLSSLILLISFSTIAPTTVLAEEPLINKYQAINILFWYYKIAPNPDYNSQTPKFQQYFKDIWPANSFYPYINTACEIKLITCDINKYFDGESPITLPAFLKLFYALKYKDRPDILQGKFESYTGETWYFPYLNEAVKTNLIPSNLKLETIENKSIFELLRREDLLSFYDGVVEFYFDGLEKDPSMILPERYYSLERINSTINQYYNIIAINTALLKNSTYSNKQKNIEEKLKTLNLNMEAFIGLQGILSQNPLLYDPNLPDTVKQAAAVYGIREKIGEATYDYTKSPAYRRYNIEVALNKISGTVLQSGEEFSFSKIVYDHNMREFKMGWVIKKGKEEMAAGGGICGAATTVFMAAYRSGLQITERKQHSVWYRSFYPIDILGLDATVYKPRPDMRFVNNTNAPLLMFVTYPSPSVANFQIWGTKHFDTLTLEGPNYNKGHTRWVRTIYYRDGNMSVDEILSYFGKRI